MTFGYFAMLTFTLNSFGVDVPEDTTCCRSNANPVGERHRRQYPPTSQRRGMGTGSEAAPFPPGSR